VSAIVVRDLGLCEYLPAWERMKVYTGNRGADSPDEIWLLQHTPVFTQGQSCSDVPVGHEHIPVVHSDRGGQITYHGPGQLVVYLLIDLRRRKIGIKSMVRLLEQCVIDYLANASIAGERRADAPGVYVGGKKIAALGLRVRRGACYHGLSINIDMDLSPFSSIEPCGFQGLEVTQLKDLGVSATLQQVQEDLARRIRQELDK
jgi:lipoyl(octanoyl) transferase